MKQISIVNRKGGSSKTALALIIGKLLTDKGYAICFEDRDAPQYSLKSFVEFLQIPNVHESQADFKIIDNAPRARDMGYQIKDSNTVIIPTKANTTDIKATQDFIQDELSEYTGKCVVVFTMVVGRTNLNKKYMDFEFSPRIRKCQTPMRFSTRYAEFVDTGTLPAELENEMANIILDLRIF